ncbi:MAG TPA: hypothetical protein VLJ39_00350 [Tepidisphaeraceae bacterium]|nr:hypothetical protein [Tepidisphaeraceae bacterium]
MKPDHEADHEDQRDGHVQQRAADDGTRDVQSREVNLGEQVLLAEQRHPAGVQCGREELPGEQGGKDEHRILRSPDRPEAAFESGRVSEHHREQDHVEQRLQHDPARPEDRLLISDLDVAPDEEVEQFARVKQLGPVDPDPPAAGLENGFNDRVFR